MSITIDKTPGSADANAYVDETDAADYFNLRVGGSEWSTHGTEDRKRGLIQATQRVDLELFVGTRATGAQALAWPRHGVTDRDGYAVASDEIPRSIAEASMELALVLLRSNEAGSDPYAVPDNTDVKRAKVGDLEVEYRDRLSSAGSGVADTLPDIVSQLLAEFRVSGSRNSVKLLLA